MAIDGLGIIILLKDLKTIMQPWMKEPFSLSIRSILDTTGLQNCELVNNVESYFGIKVSRSIEEFCSTKGLKLILNFFPKDIKLSTLLYRIKPETVSLLDGPAAQMVWDQIVKLEKITIQKEIFFQALNSTIEGIQIANAQGTEIFVNTAFLEITNLKPEDRLEKYVFDVSPDGGLAHVIKNKSSIKNIRNHPKGTNVELISNAAPILINGNYFGAVSVMQDITELQKSREAVTYLNKKVASLSTAKYSFKDIIGNCNLIQRAIVMAEKVAQVDLTVLIQGESGTGKEIFAHAIGNASVRKSGPFISVNCAAIPEQLLESEFFGHEKGAFTGANTRKLGMFELADKGTLFLDEIGDMNLNLQSKLLRVLEEKEFLRVGGTTSIKVDVRIIAATNRELLALIQEGKFRADLFYRLNVINITIPPLRERLEDLRLLTYFLIEKIKKRIGKNIIGISEDALEVLKEYRWPGNVRELENVIERASVFCQGDTIQLSDIFLPQAFNAAISIKNTEEEKITALLMEYGCSVEGKKEVARILNISLATLYNKIKLHGLDNFYLRTPKS